MNRLRLFAALAAPVAGLVALLFNEFNLRQTGSIISAIGLLIMVCIAVTGSVYGWSPRNGQSNIPTAADAIGTFAASSVLVGGLMLLLSN
jgi:formate hydrogenlyase subunit 3/multisubunit Na+/H+ antiporter MnhD subunit